MTLCDFLIIVLPTLSLARNFMILKSLTENISKSYAIILMSFLRLWSDKMICNHDLKKIEILLKLLCFFSIIVFYMMRARSLVVSELRSETKGPRFESGC